MSLQITREKGSDQFTLNQDTCIGISNLAIIGLDNGMLPIQCQAIIWNNAGSLEPGKQIPVNFYQNITTLIQENEFENVVC